MKLNYMWERFTSTKRDESGGSGIKNVTQGEKLGICSQNPYVIALTENLFFLSRLTKLQQTGTVNDYITAFEKLAIKIGGLGDDFYLECFICGLKEAIQAHV